MIELTEEKRQAIASALDREAQRLRTILGEYQRAKSGTRNMAVKAMAEEGAANVQTRAAELEALAAEMRGEVGR